jgi:hypothetical protein
MSPTAINTQTGSTYTLQASDNGKLVEMDYSGANVVTIPTGATTLVKVAIRQKGAGQTSITGATGSMVESYDNAYKLTGQYAGAVLIRVAANKYLLEGNVSA